VRARGRGQTKSTGWRRCQRGACLNNKKTLAL
jgi:hypothetical protein